MQLLMKACCREGSVLVNGTIGDAAVTSTGEGDVYVIGTTRSVAVNSSGDGDIKLRNANGKLHHHHSLTPFPAPHLAFTWVTWKPQKGFNKTSMIEQSCNANDFAK